MQMKTYKFPYSATAEIAMCLDDLGLTTGHVNHGGTQTYYEGTGADRRVGAIIQIKNYGSCRVMVREDKADEFARICDMVEAETF